MNDRDREAAAPPPRDRSNHDAGAYRPDDGYGYGEAPPTIRPQGDGWSGSDVRSSFRDGDAMSGERGLAAVMHLGGFVALLGAGPLAILVPLIMWLLKRDESPFLDDHGREAINFQISWWIWGFISGVLVLVLVGILMLLVLSIAWVILMIIAAVRANSGEYYRYPMTIRFL